MLLGFKIPFASLYTHDGLSALDARFLAWLTELSADLHARLLAARAAPESLSPKDESALLIALAPHLEDFLAELFNIRADLTALQAAHHALSPLYSCKRLFVQRRAAKTYTPEQATALNDAAMQKSMHA